MKQPWISILVPSFEYPKGVQIILDFIYLTKVSNVECIISDDSISDNVKEVVKNHPLYKNGNIRYQKNKQNSGAVINWNSLISNAKGDYLLFMHHDECPMNLNFFKDLSKIIESFKRLDLIILRCALLKSDGSKYNNHMPHFLTIMILKFFPEYLFHRNLVGSPSNIVIKRESSLNFKKELSWLVDVEWIYRLVTQTTNWILVKDLTVLSIQNQTTTITDSLREEIPKIRKAELEFLQSYYKDQKIFKILMPQTIFERSILLVENFFWVCFRVCKTLSDIFFSGDIPLWFKQYKLK